MIARAADELAALPAEIIGGQVAESLRNRCRLPLGESLRSGLCGRRHARAGIAQNPVIQKGLSVEWAQELERRIERLIVPFFAAVSLYFLGQLCRRLLAALVLTIALMFALGSYPFQPHRVLLFVEWGLAMAAIGTAAGAFLSLNMNPTLSTLGDTPARLSLDRGLVYQMILFVGVPVLTIMSLHFPEFGDLFNSAANAMKGVKL